MEYGKKKYAVWAVTKKGAKLAVTISKAIPEIDLYFYAGIGDKDIPFIGFNRLSGVLSRVFDKYAGHIFIMSTGIVVRTISPYIRHKMIDPAIVVADEIGQHVISLLSGHIGGANELAKKVAEIVGAVPVITTATDLNNIPAIDTIARETGLFLENPEAIKRINSAFLSGKKVRLHDPFKLVAKFIPQSGFIKDSFDSGMHLPQKDKPGIFVDDVSIDLPSEILVLRPSSLVAGIGCNRNTSLNEIKNFLFEILDKSGLALGSLTGIASIDLKNDEPGLIMLAEELELPLLFFDQEELNRVEDIETPSEIVEKYTGVKSVCEAAAILAAKMGKLIVPKQTTQNTTIAITRISFT